MLNSPLPCIACGTVNPAQALFCFTCGQPLHASATASNTLTGLLTADHLLKQRYRILTQIGAGGFGAVYKAADTQFGTRLVAIKEMSQRSLTPQEVAEATAAFKREALLLADLRHPNLPRIYDHFTDGGRWYLVMDFIEGQTLEEYLKSQLQGCLPPEEVLDIGTQLCNVLGYLHTRQPAIIFRDLKPANIMRTPDQHLYLIDFGIARHFKPGQVKDTMPLGSPGYAAPEQYGKLQTTPRADIYSLGVTLHQLLTGDDPTRSPFLLAPIQLHGTHTLARLETLVKQMLELDETKRPADMAVIKQTLQHIAAQQSAKQVWGLPAQETSPSYQPLTAPQGATSSRQRLLLESQQPLDPKSRRGPSRRALLLGGLAGLGLVGGATTLWQLLAQRQSTPATPLPTAVPALRPNTVMIYRGHTGQINDVAWGPDGKSLASASADKTVQVWEAESGRKIVTYRHTEVVLDVAWSPDGKQIASGAADDTVQQWSAVSGSRIFTYDTNPIALAWSPDGKYLAVADYADFAQTGQGIVQVWDIVTHRMVTSYPGPLPYSITWSPDSKRIAIGTIGATIQIWDVSTGDTPAILTGHTGWLTGVAWSPDGTYLASSSVDGSVRIWEAKTGENVFIFARHFEYGWMNTAAWSPNSLRIVSGSNNATAQVWDALTGDHLYVYRGHSNIVSSAGWSSDGKLIATGSNDRTVQVWQAP